MDTVQKLFRFLDESPTCYHAVANAKAALTAAGAVELRESEQWKLEKGTLYVVERGDSALVAFRVPEGPFHGFLMGGGPQRFSHLQGAGDRRSGFRRQYPAAQRGALRRRCVAWLAGSALVCGGPGDDPAGRPPCEPSGEH